MTRYLNVLCAVLVTQLCAAPGLAADPPIATITPPAPDSQTQTRSVAPHPKTTVPEPMAMEKAPMEGAGMAKPMMMDMSGEATVERGEMLLQEGRYAAAAEILRAAYQGDRNSAETPRGLMLLGQSYEGLGRQDLACGAMRLAARHPMGNAVINFRARSEVERLSC